MSSNRILRFVEPPRRPETSHARQDDEDEDEDERASCDEHEDEEDAGDDDDLVGEDDGDGDDSDGEDDDGDEMTPEEYLKSKVYLAMEDGASLAMGRAILHEDPNDEEKLLLTMQLDKFAEDEEMPALDGTQMIDVSLVIMFEGRGHSGPKKRILSVEKLAQLFEESNWKKNHDKDKKSK